jgi:putative membrane protein
MLTEILPALGRIVRGWWPALVVLAMRGSADTIGTLALLVDLVVGLGLFVALGTTGVVLRWATLRYRMVGDRLELRSGLLARSQRSIVAARVQNVEIVRGVLHRALGLAALRVETASGEGAEGALGGLRLDEALAIAEALRAGATAAPGVEQRVVVANGPWEVSLFGATSTPWALPLVAAVAVAQEAFVGRGGRDGSDLGGLAARADDVGYGVAAVMVVGVLVGTWLIGIGGAWLAHHGFRLVRADDGSLVVEEGLLTTRRASLPADRVQRVEVVEPVLRRLMGLATVRLESVSTRQGEPGQEHAQVVVPILPAEGVAAVLEEVLPSLPAGLLDGPWSPAHPRAVRRELIRAAVVGIAVAAGGAAIGPIGAAIGAAAAALNTGRVWLDVRSQGYQVTRGFVVVRRGWLERTTTVLSRDRVQTAEWEQGPVLRWVGLGEVTVSVAGSFVTLPLLDADEAWALAMALARRPAPAA